MEKVNYQQYLQSPQWEEKRNKKLQDYGHRCQLCNSVHSLHVHHRTYERLGNEDMNDLTVLCSICHKKEIGSYQAIRIFAK